MKAKIIILSILTLFVVAGTAMAASPEGQWTVSYYLEPGLSTGASQGICFKADGTWYSSTFSGWSGMWKQKGDRFKWYGATGSLYTAEFGQFIGKALSGGEFSHFYSSSTSSFGNWKAMKVKVTCDAQAASAYESSDDPSQ